MYQALQAAGIAFEYQKHIPFHSCDIQSETKYAYVDFAITTHWGAILLEVDEDLHAAYPASCDVRQDFDMFASVALGSGHKVAILRYNPDSFRIDGRNMRVPPKDRQRRLVGVLRSWMLEDPAPDKQLSRCFLYYDHRSGSSLPEIAKEWDNEVARAVSSVLPQISQAQSLATPCKPL